MRSELIFNIFTNYLEKEISNKFLKFAGDAKLAGVVNTSQYKEITSLNLERLESRAENKLRISLGNCKPILAVGNLKCTYSIAKRNIVRCKTGRD